MTLLFIGTRKLVDVSSCMAIRAFLRIVPRPSPPTLDRLPMSQPQSESLLAQLDGLQTYVLDELDALDARINDLIKQLVGTPALQVAPVPADAAKKSAA